MKQFCFRMLNAVAAGLARASTSAAPGMVSVGFVAATFAASAACADATAPGAVVLDSGDAAAAWSAIASPSATARIIHGRGEHGGAFGLAFDLGRGRSHAIARRTLSVDLPADYMFVFTLRSNAEPNTIEIKFISGENVWWRRMADYQFPRDWKDLRVSKPRIAFAWGPAGGGMPVHLDAIEIAVVAGKGGKGELWIDEIRIEPRRGDAQAEPPTATTTSASGDAGALLDVDRSTVWRSAPGDTHPAITLDFHEPVEQGGLVVEHAGDAFASAYVVEASSDLRRWQEIRRFTHGNGGIDDVYMPDVYSRYLRLRFSPPLGRRVAIAGIHPQPFEYSSSINGFFTAIAHRGAAGLYPRYFAGEQSYWAVVGAAGDAKEALVNEEGSVEVDAGAFTLEPFVYRDGTLRTWKDGASSVSLEDDDLPMPTVLRRDGDLSLLVTAFAAGPAGASTLYVRYRLKNDGAESNLRFFVALRPFQVLPPWQALNRIGGVADLTRIARDHDTIRADDHRVVAVTPPTAFGAAAFEEGDVTSFLVRGLVPPSSSVVDPFAHASAALAWDVHLSAGSTRDVWLAVPWWKGSHVATGRSASPFPGAAPRGGDAAVDAAFAATKAEWRARVDRVGIELPEVARDWANSLRSNLAWVLINRDGPAIQPGSRTYERSWIRDGAMTSGALLELGFSDEVKEFLRWYAGYVGKDGRVPCCVDARGADPVPENDSYGEFLWAVADVWRFTRDEAFVREMWPQVKAVAACMSRLRATRMTAEYTVGDKRAFYGLLPESISHEGYSARPVHSYWDQAFALRGYADAAMLARVVGDGEAAAGFDAERDSFEKTLRESILATMAAHHMDLVPASVELGDFDPTSTAVSFLLGTDGVYPRAALERSFDKYVRDLHARRGLATPGVGYTAYELRSATALVMLGRKADAIDLLGTLTVDQRPPAWNQWPEISWLRRDEPSFLGDLPHTWIGSTYVHAVRTLLVSEREGGGSSSARGPSLLVGAGIALAWLDGHGEVKGRAMPTWFGALTFAIRRDGGVGTSGGSAQTAPVGGLAAPTLHEPAAAGPRVVVELADGADGRDAASGVSPRHFTMPDGGIDVAAPFGADVEAATIDGVATRVEQGSVRVARLPATVVFQYKPRLENPS